MLLALAQSYLLPRDIASRPLDAMKTADEPWMYLRIATLLLLSGKYYEGTHIARQGYDLFSQRGCVSGMLSCALLVGNGHANNANIDDMLHWYAICRNLNDYVHDAYVHYILLYNEGASLLMLRRWHEGYEKLLLARDALIPSYDRAMLHQKLALAAALCNDAQTAQASMDFLSWEGASLSLAVVQVVTYILEHPEYNTTRMYCTLLESCIALTREAPALPKGCMEFFALFLLDAYRGTRQYKKAFKLLKLCNFSTYL